MSFIDTTLPAMQRIRQYLRSAGRYGSSPFLVGHYGGLGETAQGFCRTSAVKGGTYILGRRVISVTPPRSPSDNAPPDEKSGSAAHGAGPHYSVRLEDFDEPLTAKVLVSSPDYLPAALTTLHASNTDTSSSPAICSTARCIAIIDKPVVFAPTDPPEEPAETEDGAPGVASYDVDTALLVFPPRSVRQGSDSTAAYVLVTGEGTMSAPRGKCE